jgi:hypothetical protein
LQRKEIGIITKFKARLVAQGFSQRYGIDFEKTYAPVMNVVTYRLLVAFGTKYGLEMRQIDFDTAYLNADIDKEIYMSAPDGMKYESGLKNPVVRLMKSIYGLK